MIARALLLPAIGLMLAVSPSYGKTVAYNSLCQVASWPREKAGLKFRAKAVYVTDRVENTFLKDKSCPDLTVEMGDARKYKLDRSIYRFEFGIQRDGLKYGIRRFSIDFSGIFIGSKSGDSHAVVIMTKIWKVEEVF